MHLPVVEHTSTVRVHRMTGRIPARVAKLVGPVPLLGVLALPLGALALVLARGRRGRVRDDARQGLVTGGGLHVVIGVFAFLVAALS